eukprot:TRINITY_DN509_c0_g1_i3.p1 TRINITY_DN509_c0_g1~~TRINITY_DN509_c0_g1_i3.p1  ORF type:complete len:477 (-),score=91.16 TRINITY_DN509_c0_g1_i3:1215-2645(-)
MLTIRRVPTVMSLNEEGMPGCGKECLGACCMSGTKLALYSFARRYSIKPKRVRSFGDLHTVPDLYDAVISSGSSDGASDCDLDDKSLLDTLLLAEWEDRMERGLFRYDVTACQTKVLPGQFGFVAQLNEGRHLKKRPTEFRVDQVLQDFDPKKFNFTKVGKEEVLFRFEESEHGYSGYEEDAIVNDSPNVVVINVSPIEYGHVLLVPRVCDYLPQRIQLDTLLLAMHMAVEADNPYFRLGYNSLGAFATINQLHFQAYYLSAPFPIERAMTVRERRRKRKRSLKVSTLSGYPVRALVYEVGNSLEEVAVAVAAACQELELRNIPFNLLIADRGARVFLMPQCFAAKQARGEVPESLLVCQVNPAAWEISGHMVLKQKQDYENATEEYACALLSAVSLSAADFEEVKKICLEEGEKAMEECLPTMLEMGLARPSMPVVRPASPSDVAIVPTKGGRHGRLNEDARSHVDTLPCCDAVS